MKHKIRNFLIAIGFLGVASAAVILPVNKDVKDKVNPYVEDAQKYTITSPKGETTLSKTEPKVDFKRGGDTLSFSYGLSSTATLDGDKVQWKGVKEEVHAYPIDDENFEVEIILKEKPSKNTFSFTIDGWEDFDFYLQSAEAGTPQNIIGSYAVYHKTKRGNQYGTGKFLHIYRPKIIDANKDEVWGTLVYENGVLTVVVPQSFLDNAVYPVKVDPTFGKTSDGASSTAASADNKLTSRATPSTSGTVVSLTCRLWLSSAGIGPWRGVIYSSVTDSPTALLAVTDDSTFTSTTEAEQTASFSGANLISIVAGTQYWIGFHVQDPGLVNWTVSRDGTANQRITNGDDVWLGGTDDPHSADKTSLSGPIDCYVTYTEPATGTKGYMFIPKLK